MVHTIWSIRYGPYDALLLLVISYGPYPYDRVHSKWSISCGTVPLAHTIWVYMKSPICQTPILGLFLLYFVMTRKFRNKLSVLMMILLLTKGGLKYFQREISSRPKSVPQDHLEKQKTFRNDLVPK